MPKHAHLTKVAFEREFEDIIRRMNVKDVSLAYMRGVVDGALLAYSESSCCPTCRKQFHELSSRIEQWSNFLEESPPISQEWLDFPYKPV
jgi:predicted  nucleic acid-binding Zn ribbon protein